MKFSQFIKAEKRDLTESVTPEQKKKYQELEDQVNEIADQLKAKLKHIPIKLDANNLFIQVGTDSFQIEGIPSFSLRINRDDKLEISQSSTTFTKESTALYAKMLEEAHANFDLIEKSLKAVKVIKDKSYDL